MKKRALVATKAATKARIEPQGRGGTWQPHPNPTVTPCLHAEGI